MDKSSITWTRGSDWWLSRTTMGGTVRSSVGPAAEDSYKCADYLCRAVTGRWLSDEAGEEGR